jgi:hypothetical protein
MKYRTVFTATEARDNFGEYLDALVLMGLAETFAGYRNVQYYGVIVGEAMDMIDEFKQNEMESKIC